jgi:hypothetical protein
LALESDVVTELIEKEAIQPNPEDFVYDYIYVIINKFLFSRKTLLYEDS